MKKQAKKEGAGGGVFGMVVRETTVGSSRTSMPEAGRSTNFLKVAFTFCELDPNSNSHSSHHLPSLPFGTTASTYGRLLRGAQVVLRVGKSIRSNGRRR